MTLALNICQVFFRSIITNDTRCSDSNSLNLDLVGRTFFASPPYEMFYSRRNMWTQMMLSSIIVGKIEHCLTILAYVGLRMEEIFLSSQLLAFGDIKSATISSYWDLKWDQIQVCCYILTKVHSKGQYVFHHPLTIYTPPSIRLLPYKCFVTRNLDYG